jgi:O-antigen/teichoic acid export membrane protein
VAALVQRLVASGAAYQTASLVSAGLGALLLPVYTRALTPADYGLAETLLTYLILASIPLRMGLQEAFVRFWFDDEDPERRRRVAKIASGSVLITTTVASLLAVAFAGPLSELLLDERDATLFAFGVLGLWSFSNLEVAYAMLRVEERRRTYLTASLINVGLTIALTLVLVVGFDTGARGYVAGNYVASALVLFGLWWLLRDRLGFQLGGVRPLLRFGGPTIPADMAVFALNVVDRAYLLQTQGKAAAGVYAVSVKLSTAVIVAVRGFQLAWPPLAYSIADDDEARRFYARVTTWYVVVVGSVVAALTLLGHWLVVLLAAPDFREAEEALAWVALGWAGYGLFLVFVVIAGRAKVTVTQLPAALVGLVINVVLLVLLVDPLGIAGAGIALGASYVAMMVVLALLTRRSFRVPFEWGRLAHAVAVIGGIAVAGELLLPDEGLAGLVCRALALGIIPLALALTSFAAPDERAMLRALRGGVLGRASAAFKRS